MPRVAVMLALGSVAVASNTQLMRGIVVADARVMSSTYLILSKSMRLDRVDIGRHYIPGSPIGPSLRDVLRPTSDTQTPTFTPQQERELIARARQLQDEASAPCEAAPSASECPTPVAHRSPSDLAVVLDRPIITRQSVTPETVRALREEREAARRVRQQEAWMQHLVVAIWGVAAALATLLFVVLLLST